MPDDKVIDRIEKLLRRAAPSSGSSPNEREIAALEAARLFSEHDLAVVAKPPPAPKSFRRGRAPATVRPPAPPVPRWDPQPYQSPSGWTAATAPMLCRCVACGKPIPRGAACWRDEDIGYRCHNITCDS